MQEQHQNPRRRSSVSQSVVVGRASGQASGSVVRTSMGLRGAASADAASADGTPPQQHNAAPGSSKYLSQLGSKLPTPPTAARPAGSKGAGPAARMARMAPHTGTEATPAAAVRSPEASILDAAGPLRTPPGAMAKSASIGTPGGGAGAASPGLASTALYKRLAGMGQASSPHPSIAFGRSLPRNTPQRRSMGHSIGSEASTDTLHAAPGVAVPPAGRAMRSHSVHSSGYGQQQQQQQHHPRVPSSPAAPGSIGRAQPPDDTDGCSLAAAAAAASASAKKAVRASASTVGRPTTSGGMIFKSTVVRDAAKAGASVTSPAGPAKAASATKAPALGLRRSSVLATAAGAASGGTNIPSPPSHKGAASTPSSVPRLSLAGLGKAAVPAAPGDSPVRRGTRVERQAAPAVRLSYGDWVSSQPAPRQQHKAPSPAVPPLRLSRSPVGVVPSPSGESSVCYSDIDLTPLRMVSMDDCDSPPLLPRERSSGHEAAPSQLPSQESSAASFDSTVAVAAKGLSLSLHRLSPDADAVHDSPPKHRRERGDGGEAAARGSHKPACVSQLKLGALAMGGARSLPHREGSILDAIMPPAAGKAPPSPNKATPVPRLDLTPVLASQELELGPSLDRQQASAEEAGGGATAAQEQAWRQEAADDDSPAESPRQAHVPLQRAGSGSVGALAGKSPARPRLGSGQLRRPGSAQQKRPGSGHKGGSSRKQASAEPPADEAFYVYKHLDPEQVRQYEDLKRLVAAHGRGKAAASLDKLWADLQEARANTEAMAFRGHRLLDQVSSEFNTFRHDAAEERAQMLAQQEALQADREAWREQAQYALSVVPASSGEVALLQQENQQLAAQNRELERALEMAAAHVQAQGQLEAPGREEDKARMIAESATTNILLKKAFEQEQELQEKGKMIHDLKAALLLMCEALKRCGFAQGESQARIGFPTDTLDIIDAMLATSTDRVQLPSSEPRAPARPAYGNSTTHVLELPDSHEAAALPPQQGPQAFAVAGGVVPHEQRVVLEAAEVAAAVAVDVVTSPIKLAAQRPGDVGVAKDQSPASRAQAPEGVV